MSNLLSLKIAEAHELIEQADQEDLEREKLVECLAKLRQETALLEEKTAGLQTSIRHKRVIAKSQLAAAQSLSNEDAAAAEAKPAGATIIEIGSAKTAAVSQKKAPRAKATKAAKTETTPVAAKETKAKGGKGKAAKAAEKVAASAKTAAPVKAPRKTKTAAKAETPRVASDDRMPPLRERLKIVMGEDSVSIQEAIDRLNAKDPAWVPDSTDLKGYISLALSTHKDVFERVRRGVYSVRKNAAAVAKPVRKASSKNGHGAANGAGSLEELGSNVAENPFATVAA